MKNGSSKINHEQNYILTRVGTLNIVFPSIIISEILIIETSQILAIPFYQHSVTGCVHHQGKIIALISLNQILQIPFNPTRKLSVICLNENADSLEGIGIIIEKVLGIKPRSELPTDLFQFLETENMLLFNASLIDSKLWQPLRFQK